MLWKLKDEANGNDRQTNAMLIREKLLALRGNIAGMTMLEVGFDVSRTAASGDVVLYSEFIDLNALAAYQIHPEHEALKPFIGAVTLERQVVDYEV